jgi:hypothetical protein
MDDERGIGEDLEGSGRGLTEVISRNFCGAIEENKERTQCPGPVSKRALS